MKGLINIFKKIRKFFDDNGFNALNRWTVYLGSSSIVISLVVIIKKIIVAFMH